MYHSEGDVDDRGGYADAGAGSIWKTAVSTQLCYETKTAQKHQSMFFWRGEGNPLDVLLFFL